MGHTPSWYRVDVHQCEVLPYFIGLHNPQDLTFVMGVFWDFFFLFLLVIRSDGCDNKKKINFFLRKNENSY